MIILVRLLFFILILYPCINGCSSISEPVNPHEENWQKFNRGDLPFGSVHDVEVTQNGTLILATDRNILVSADNGDSFNERFDQTFWNLTSTANGVVVAGGSAGKIYYTLDNGLTWKSPSELSGLETLETDSAGVLYAGTGKGVMISYDIGRSWKALGYDNGTIRAISARSEIDIFIGLEGNLVRRSPSRAGWHEIYTFPKNVLSIVYPAKGRILVGTERGLYLSTNNGHTWTVKLESRYVLAMLVTDDGKVYAGTNGGIYRSDNDGDNWKSVSKLGFVVALTQGKDGAIYAATRRSQSYNIYKKQ